MSRSTLNSIAVLSFALTIAGPASAATVDMVLGTIVEPAGIKRGDTLAPNAVVRAGTDGLIVFSESWATGTGPAHDCVEVTIVGYGATDTVRVRGTRQRCVPRALGVPEPGRPIVDWGTRVARGKADDMLPPGFAASESAWGTFDAWQRRQTTNGPGVTGVMGPLVPGLVYLQGDYRSAPSSSAAACAALCAGEPECRAMTFIISQQLCWLKNTVPATASSGDMVSAVKK